MSRSDKQDASLVGGAMGPYSDWTHYTPINSPGTLPARATFLKPLNPDHWQPLTYTDSTGNLVIQMFSGAQWPFVTPFALTDCAKSPVAQASACVPAVVATNLARGGSSNPLLSFPLDFFRKLLDGEGLSASLDPPPAKFGSPEYQQQAEELVSLSANLTDRQKMLAEFWTASPDSDSPVAHWIRFAEFVSARDHLTLDDQIKLFFVLSNAMTDADIAAYGAKRAY